LPTPRGISGFSAEQRRRVFRAFLTGKAVDQLDRTLAEQIAGLGPETTHRRWARRSITALVIAFWLFILCRDAFLLHGGSVARWFSAVVAAAFLLLMIFGYSMRSRMRTQLRRGP
jgi:hypothetical protein